MRWGSGPVKTWTRGLIDVIRKPRHSPPRSVQLQGSGLVTELCSRHHNLQFRALHHPKKPISISSHPHAFSTPPPAVTNTNLLSVCADLLVLNVSCTGTSCVRVFPERRVCRAYVCSSRLLAAAGKDPIVTTTPSRPSMDIRVVPTFGRLFIIPPRTLVYTFLCGPSPRPSWVCTSEWSS